MPNFKSDERSAYGLSQEHIEQNAHDDLSAIKGIAEELEMLFGTILLRKANLGITNEAYNYCAGVMAEALEELLGKKWTEAALTVGTTEYPDHLSVDCHLLPPTQRQSIINVNYLEKFLGNLVGGEIFKHRMLTNPQTYRDTGEDL